VCRSPATAIRRWKIKPQDHRRRGRTGLVWLVFVALLICPTLAGVKLARVIDYRALLGFFVLISLTTFLLYWRDKRAAEARRWRTPEATLHLLELLGGWPAAFVAQRLFRHKTSKLSYQITFWAIVAAHQAVAIELLREGSDLRRLLPQSLAPRNDDHPSSSKLPVVVPGPSGRDRLK